MGVIAKWIEFRRQFIENMPIDERKKIFPESLEDGYNWEVEGLADYMRVHMPPPKQEERGEE